MRLREAMGTLRNTLEDQVRTPGLADCAGGSGGLLRSHQKLQDKLLPGHAGLLARI